MLWRLVVVVGVLALSTVTGLVWQRRAGRFRPTVAPMTEPAPTLGPSSTPDQPAASAPGARTLGADRLGSALGSRATLLQFSSAFCAPCRAARVLLADVASIVPGVEHIEVDAESHLELVRELKVLSTPTVFVLDADGVVVSRATGLPKRQLVLAALAHALPATGPDAAYIAP
ncbi:MAG TPA: thioredoxin family protein [Actinopolymorphaceae bacterium]|jgi:thiol-disulfide isomerase/thioredoxin